MFANQNRPARMDHVPAGAWRVAVLIAFDQPKTAQHGFLRSILGKPAFRSKTSGFKTKLLRGDQRRDVGTSLSATDDLNYAKGHIRRLDRHLTRLQSSKPMATQDR